MYSPITLVSNIYNCQVSGEQIGSGEIGCKAFVFSLRIVFAIRLHVSS
jgi:hypothetical protein